MKNYIKHIITNAVVLVVLLVIMCAVNYIDLSVVITIYLPIFVISSMLMIFKKHYIGNIFIMSAELGLIAEYILNSINADKPNMSGAFLNIAILTGGLILGIIVQIYKNKNQ